jgi:long-chain-fatty-acid--CoA ligase ACSBG
MDFIKSDKLSPVENFTSTDPKESVKIIKTATEVSPREPLTVPELLSRVVEENGDRIAMMYESGEKDGWTPVTYAEYKQRAEQVAKAFIKLGLEEHGSVAVLAFNSVEWFLSQLGAIHAG